MARPKNMIGYSTNDDDVIREQADRFSGPADKSDENREAAGRVRKASNSWRHSCVDRGVDPVILAQSIKMRRLIEIDPNKATRHWRLLKRYLKVVGFFDQLVPDLLEELDQG